MEFFIMTVRSWVISLKGWFWLDKLHRGIITEFGTTAIELSNAYSRKMRVKK